jgi:hypothetical protein
MCLFGQNQVRFKIVSLTAMGHNPALRDHQYKIKSISFLIVMIYCIEILIDSGLFFNCAYHIDAAAFMNNSG